MSGMNCMDSADDEMQANKMGGQCNECGTMQKRCAMKTGMEQRYIGVIKRKQYHKALRNRIFVSLQEVVSS